MAVRTMKRPVKVQGIERAATAMRSLLAGTAGLRFVYRRLDLGTEVVIERREDERLRLAVARVDRAPAADELATIGDAFGVPAGCEWGGGKRQAMNGRSLFVCEVFWREG